VYQLVYVSSAVKPLNQSELADLLQQAHAANRQRGLTGALLYSDGNFIQVLEGPEQVVSEIFAKICQDSRHHGVLKLLGRTITERSFPDWAMGWPKLDRSKVGQLPAWRDWEQMSQVAREGAARTLIAVFCQRNA
jgi:hypothetical protein